MRGCYNTRMPDKKKERFDKIKEKSPLYLEALLFSFCACFFFSTSTSPLYLSSNADYINLDSNFFLYEASAWLKGQVPYLDFFDHKGLFHVAIDAFGLLLGGRIGVFCLQILAGFLGLIFLFKTIEALAPKRNELLLLAGVLYFALYTISPCGNSEGEWMLPFVSAFFYFFVRGMKEESRKGIRLACFFAGLEVGFALNSRPLDALWGGVGVIAYFVYYLKKKWGIELLYDALLAIGGLLIPFVLFWPDAFIKGYAEVMFRSIFVDGFSYVPKGASGEVEVWINRGIILVVLAAEVFFYRYEKKKGDPAIALPFLIVSLLSSLLYLLVARYYSYYWSGYTFYILDGVYALSLIPPLGEKKLLLPKIAWPTLGSLVTLWALALVSLYYTVGLNDFSAKQARNVEAAVLRIPEKERQSPGHVYALDCDPKVYTIGGFISQEKYFANQSWWSTFKSGVKDEVRAYLSSETKPRYVLVSEAKSWTKENFGDVIEKFYQIVPGSTALSGGAFSLYSLR